MDSIPMLETIRYWKCPSCKALDTTRRADVHSRMHHCPRFEGLSMPMVQLDGPEDPDLDLKHEVVVRGDYVGSEIGLRFDGDNRPVMAILTHRPDGSYDTAVMAGTARTKREARAARGG